MRTTMLFLAAGAAALGACKWTEFDDLENQTWVGSTEKPDIKSSDYDVVIQRGADASESTTGGTLAVIGSGPGVYMELQYGANGATSFKANSTLQLPALGIMTLDSPPILLASPTSAEVALVTTGDSASIVVATGTHTLVLRQLFVGTNTTLGGTETVGNTPDAATYMQPLPFPGADPNPTPAPLVAVGNIVMGTIYAQPQGTKQPACKLTDGTTAVQVRALGTVKAGATDDVLVWNGTDGKLLRYDGKDAFNGCSTTSPKASTSPANTPAFLPGHGSQILTVDAGHVLLQGHADLAKGNASFLQVYDTSTLSPVGAAVTAEGLRSAALLDAGTGRFVVAGYPTASVNHDNSSVPAGQVLVYKLSTGIDSATPVAALYDAQPEADHLFGRSVAVMPYNGTRVVAVSAENEVFLYFRLNTTDGTAMSIYGETRQGR
jgi:hypothetical protein